MNSAISGLIVAAVTLAIIVQSVNSLTCYTGGGAGAAAIYLPGECDAKETLCKFKNGSAAGIEFKLAQGCEEASATKKAVRILRIITPRSPATMAIRSNYMNVHGCISP